ncbi:MAG: 30S ribosomal protein S6 [Patescibacteria group bacterium]
MNYELSFLTQNLDAKSREDLLKRMEETIGKLKGKLEDKFIEKKYFAYPVKKNQEGFLGQIDFILGSENLGDFREYLKTEKAIIRTLIEKKKVGQVSVSRRERFPLYPKTAPTMAPKKEKAKIEELDKKLDEILK